MKHCPTCNQDKDLSEFWQSKAYKDGYRTPCKQCNKEQVWMGNLLRKYGIKPKEFLNLFHQQGGRCSICKVSFNGRPHIDHDHNTGLVRGLLCGKCNSALGFFDDNIELVRNALTYLEKNVKIVEIG